MIWWLAFEKKPSQFWQEIWIKVVVILLQLYKGFNLNSKFWNLRPFSKQSRQYFQEFERNHFYWFYEIYVKYSFNESNMKREKVKDWCEKIKILHEKLFHPIVFGRSLIFVWTMFFQLLARVIYVLQCHKAFVDDR